MSLPQPPLITYNLRERGRKHTGVDRNINIHALKTYINSPAFQEKIKNRAVTGYYGHGMRKYAGLEPVENVVIAGKVNDIEPATLTTLFEIDDDGTVRHQTEFLDTVPGRKAARAYGSRVGGFSSAIDGKSWKFHGFDYVLDPNYATNRGFILDSAGEEGDEPESVELILDSIQREEEGFIQRLLDTKDHQIAMLTAALDSAQADNEQYLSMLASRDIAPILDSAPIMPMSVSIDHANRLKRDMAAFHNEARLPGFVPIINPKDDSTEREYKKTRSMLGY